MNVYEVTLKHEFSSVITIAGENVLDAISKAQTIADNELELSYDDRVIDDISELTTNATGIHKIGEFKFKDEPCSEIKIIHN